jgi:hypothetical protein
MRAAIRTFASAALPLAAGLLFSLCSIAQQVPKNLQPAANERRFLILHAKGVQIYSCKVDGGKYSWTLKAPEAQLFDKSGKPFGKHFAGPSWEANDGSSVTGKAVADVPFPHGRILPWLLLTAVSHTGEGVLARVTSIQRINTKGGILHASGCDAAHAGQEDRVPYSADYVFFAPK